MSPLHVLSVVNKQLPEGDYRLSYATLSKVCTVRFALPEKPDILAESEFIQMGFCEGWRPQYILEFIKLFFHLLKNRQKYNIIHFYSTNLILFGPILSRLAGIPCVLSVTGFGRVFTSGDKKYELLKPVYLFILRIAIIAGNRVLLQNHNDLQLLLTLFPKSSYKFNYIGSAVSIPVVNKKDFNTAKLKILLVSRLLPDKGIQDFLEVAMALHGEKYGFVLVGPASLGFDKLLNRVISYHQKGIIDYKGEMAYSDILEEYKNAHLLYFPSYGEGMSRVMLEAGFSLVCPVAYDIPANCDLIVDGRGFLTGIGDTQKVIKILRILSRDRKLLEICAHSYQEFIVQNYNMDVYTARLDALFVNVAKEVGFLHG